MEDKIPAEGLKADFIEPYEPNNSGNTGFKKGLKPVYLKTGSKP